MEIKTKAKKWGSSLGVILPKSIVDKSNIRENDEIRIEIKTNQIDKEFFGRFPRKSKRTAQELKDEARKGWD